MALRLGRLLLYAGIASTVVGLSKLHALWNGYDYTSSSRLAWSLALIGLLAVSAYGAGLPDLASGVGHALRAGAATTATTALVFSIVQLFAGDLLLPRFVVLSSALILPFWYAVCGAVSNRARLRANGHDRLLIIGSSEDVAGIASDLESRSEKPASVVKILDVAEAQVSALDRRPVVDRALGEGISVLVLDRDAQANESVVAQAAFLHRHGVRVRTLADFCAEWLGKLPVSELEQLSLMFDIGEIHRHQFGRVKRLFDLTVALPGLVVLAIAAPLVAIGNRVGNRGPLMYRQLRVGRDGQVIEVLKFRTMRPESASSPTEWTLEDDPRVTRFGHFLRTTHLDELPQLVNIVRGDLAVVGPRPEQPAYVDELREKIPFYDLRHIVRPGLTGWAQVKYGYAGNDADALEKLQYEFFYLRHQRLSLEVRILGRTIRSVVGQRGR